jgi:protein transport protein SEC13
MAQAAAPRVTQEVSNGPIYVDTQHEDLVHDSQLDYYGCKLATASSGEIIIVYITYCQ